MKTARGEELQEFVTQLKAAFGMSRASPAARAFADDLSAALDTPSTQGQPESSRLPVCEYLPKALRHVRVASASLGKLATAFEKIEPHLAWKVRPSGGPNASNNWPDGHANAVIIGMGGLEERDDVMIGVSLMAPNVRYPDHTHPPEELYLVLTPGRFQHGADDWEELGPLGTFHNSPNIKHAMASGESPLLAVWTMISRQEPGG